MKNLLHISVLFLTLVSANLFAQTPDKLVAEIRSAAEDSCITVSYVLDAKVDDASLKDKGTVTAQDDLWCLKGQTIEVYTCEDGTWILHTESKEAVVEPKWTYDDLEKFYKTILSTSASNDVQVKIVSKTMTEKNPVSFYVPKTGADWIVTDLR